ncbi:MAG: polysaccharide deacetylase family protein [Acidimicrobiaceae bacterium]
MNQVKYRLAQLVSSTQRTKPTYQVHRRVLMYHSISQHKLSEKNIYSLSHQDFAQHVELLHELHKTENSKVVKLDSTDKSGITITFDDGYRDTLTIAAQTLAEKKLPFTVFVSSANITSGDSKFLNRQELIELSNISGATIGSHGHAHTHLAKMPQQDVTSDLKHSKDWLEQIVQRPVTTLSYPHGSYNDDVVRIAAEIGFEFAATSKWGVFEVGTKKLEIPRIDIWSQDSRKVLQQKLLGQWEWIARLI